MDQQKAKLVKIDAQLQNDKGTLLGGQTDESTLTIVQQKKLRKAKNAHAAEKDKIDKFLVAAEDVLLRIDERSNQTFGFLKAQLEQFRYKLELILYRGSQDFPFDLQEDLDVPDGLVSAEEKLEAEKTVTQSLGSV